MTTRNHGRSSDDYHSYVTRLERLPTATAQDYSLQNNIHTIFKREPPAYDHYYVEANETRTIPDHHERPEFTNNIHRIFRQKPRYEYEEVVVHPSRGKTHVKFVEEDETCGGVGREETVVRRVVEEEEDVNSAAVNFIRRRHTIMEQRA